jgi:hypothetical protein
MFIYWILFLLPVYFLLGKTQNGANTTRIEWQLFWFFLVILIGLRNEVGCDWFAYLEGLEQSKSLAWSEIFYSRHDAAHILFGWLSIVLNTNEYGINLIYAGIFAFGLIKLSIAQPYPWLAILVAIPYLVIVVAMGYTRQASAIGLLMYGFIYLVQGRVFIYLLLVLFAGLIHKTAFVFVAFAFFLPGSSRLRSAVGVCLLIGMVGGAFLVEQAEIFVLNYVTYTMDSSGAQIRTLMNLPPALIFFANWSKWGLKYKDRWLWGIFALISFVCVPLVFVASTAVDRMALYLIPLQLVVWARFPALMNGYMGRTSAILLVAVYYLMVQFIWLVFGIHAYCWVPYDNLLLPSFLRDLWSW